MTREELIELIMASPSVSGDGESFKDYLISLRSNRNELVSNIMSENNCENKKEAKKQLLTKAKNIQNQTRGKLGELLGRVALTQQTDATDSCLVTDKVVFDTPNGKRRIDVYWQESGLAAETKMGYVTNSKSIRNQIEKDAYLIGNGDIKSVIWMLIKGGSKNLKANLDKHDIPYKEGWPI